MLDNFLAKIVGMGEMDRGVTEFFRELPGIALIFILAAFYTLSAVLGLRNSAYAASIRTRKT